MNHKCSACSCEQDCETAGEAADAATLPAGWFLRNIDYTDFVLCDVCGDASQFRGGLSPYLADALDLDPDACFDVSIEVAQARDGRRSMRGRRKPT